MKTKKIGKKTVNVHIYNTIIVGAGAAGMNCAVHLYEFMEKKGVKNAQKKIAIITAGLGLGASRMSGSDKQTYYKMGTSPNVADSAEEFAKSLTAAGCAHGDLILAESIGSLREFYHLVQVGVPFPHDPMGSYCGYKTDHDPYERATSAGPKTSRFMSECLQKVTELYGIPIFDNQEAAQLLTIGSGDSKRIVGIVTVDRKSVGKSKYSVNVFLGANMVLAGGGPGAMYETSVYPLGQIGIHGLAFEAGLAGENLTESQFGLASTKFRWNVSGTYMQVIPRIFSTDAKGKDEKEFLTGFFPTMSKMATDIFLKGYQWPFDPQRIENLQSSLVDILVFNENQKGRRVFMDFKKNPIPGPSMKRFDLNDLEPEALTYLQKTGALQATPIERLAHMNPLAIDIYKENGIDLYTEPLEISVCSQHNNGGFSVNKWWQSNIPGTFVIGEMAGTHGVKRPGGSALNSGQTGGLRAAEYIANACCVELPDYKNSDSAISAQLTACINKLNAIAASKGKRTPDDVIKEIQQRMTAFGGHIRHPASAKSALADAVKLYGNIQSNGFKLTGQKDLITAVQARHMALASVGYLKAIVTLLEQGSGSRGSHLVLAEDGTEIHPDVIDKATGKPLKFKPENKDLRNSIIRIKYDSGAADLFLTGNIAIRPAPTDRKAFEPAWQDFREGKIYN
jgi:succinate dehydrogenase/fumarate reductase flavoprotein subunit